MLGTQVYLPTKGADFLDTGTHIVMGVALCGLALADPVVSADASYDSAVFAGVVVGSLIPDVDTVLKLRNNAIYIRHHRGITHSIPAVLLWPLLIYSTVVVCCSWSELYSCYGRGHFLQCSYMYLLTSLIRMERKHYVHFHIDGSLLG